MREVSKKIIAAFLILTGLMSVFHAEGAQNPAFQQTFGSIELNKPYTYRFAVPGSVSQDVRIKSVDISCDCITVMAYSESAAIGSDGFVDILFIPDRLGDVDYTITVTFDELSGRNPYIIGFSGCVKNNDNPTGQLQDVFSLIPHSRVGGVFSPDMSCYCDIAKIGSGNEVLVDVRSPENFRECHIPGAINIPSHVLETKTFLKGRKVVLVDEGYGIPETESLCRTLRQSGFGDMAVLRGGLCQWLASGGAPVGTQDANGIYRINEGVFRSLQRLDTTLAIYAGSPNEQAECLLYNALRLQPDDPEFISKAAKAVADRKAQQIVLVTEDGKNSAVLREKLLQLTNHVFCLSDGLSGYVQSLRMQEAFASRSTVTVKNTQSQVSERSFVRNSPQIKKGCGCGK